MLLPICDQVQQPKVSELAEARLTQAAHFQLHMLYQPYSSPSLQTSVSCQPDPVPSSIPKELSAADPEAASPAQLGTASERP